MYAGPQVTPYCTLTPGSLTFSAPIMKVGQKEAFTGQLVRPLLLSGALGILMQGYLKPG